MDYLSEAFKQLEILNEDVFDLDKDGLEDLKDFQDETEEEVIDVIDPDAENEEELEDSYIGKVILDCSVCHTDIYKDKEDVIIDEETQLANVGEECPYCFSVDGFKVIGEVKPFVETEFETDDDVEVEVDGEEVEDEEDEEEDDEEVEKNESFKRHKKMIESISRRNRKSLTEAPIYGLEPRYDARKSFYGKAQVDTGDNGDKNKLYSYGTLVAEIKNGKPVVYGTYSATTLRHIKGWLKQNGFKAETSRQILADYGVKDESCGRKSVKESKSPMKVSKRPIKESCSINQCQKWVDYDMKKYKRISDDTMEKIKSSGYSVVKDQYGDYEVIADRKDTSKNEACGGKRKSRKRVAESKMLSKTRILKESMSDSELAREIEKAVEWLKKNQQGCSTIKLDNRLAVCVGWLSGYSESTSDGHVHAEDDPSWCVNAGIKVWTSDSMRTDYEYINAPYDEDTGDVWDTDITISEDENYSELAKYFMKEYREMSEYDIEEDGAIVGKWSDDEEFEESLKNRKSRKMEESIGSDLKKFLDFYEDRLNQQENADVIEKIDAILDDNDLSGDTDIDKLFYAMNFSDREKIMSLIDGAKKVSPWRDLRKMKESIEDIKIDTGDQEITVSARDKEKVESDGEMIAPLSDETKTDIEMNTEEEENGDEVDVDMDEFSEEEFDDLGESYLKKVYENVDSYKTTSVSEKGNKLKVEGLIKFTSGKTKKTSFVFEAKTIDKNGHAKFLGENLQISRGHKSFKLSGTVSNNKFIAESLNYNYRAKNGKNSQRVYGTVKVNKK